MINVTIDGVYKRLKDWLFVNSLGANVTDYALDLINRANSHLATKPDAPDTLLIKKEKLILVDRSATLPIDCIGVLTAYADYDNDGKPDRKYFNRSEQVGDGYYITSVFSKDTGNVQTITFFQAPGTDVFIEYRAQIPIYVGTGETTKTEYLIYPEELTLRAAQFLIVIDKGLQGDEYQKVKAAYDMEWGNYMTAVVLPNLDSEETILDNYGYPYYPSHTNLRGGYGYGRGQVNDNSRHINWSRW
jgi:hypothetical protein